MRGRGRDAVRAVDVEPDAALLADVGERVDRVDRAGQRRPGGGDDGDGRDTRRAVCVDRGVDRIRAEPPRVVHLQRAHVVGADPEQLRRSDDGVVRLLRAVERRAGARHALAPRPWKRALAGRGERRDVRDRAAARERPGGGGEPDELAHPADRLVLHLGRRPCPDGEVDVEARREQVAQHADLEAGRADEGEEPRARLGDRHVEQLCSVVERGERARPVPGERRAEQCVEPLVDVRLAGPCAVEALPRARDDRRRALQRLLAAGVEAERRKLGRGAHRRVVVPEPPADAAGAFTEPRSRRGRP